MSNVVTLKPLLRQDETARQSRLIAGFARDRRLPDDVFWLKENAEFLGILAATGAKVTPDALEPFHAFHAQIRERMQFFPQYYRFLLSICLDLEDLGLPGTQGAELAHWVAREGLAEAELSDLQRAEARRLLARRDAAGARDSALDARLHQFISRADTFAMPIKKAAYELTHIVFYLSEYGRQDPGLDIAALTSLHHAGLLAYLDQNADLLAEVCTALRFAGQTPSAMWEAAVADAHGDIAITGGGPGDLNDAYHEYLVTGWAMQVAGQAGFGADVPDAPPRFQRAYRPQGALRAMSEAMFDLGGARRADWGRMRPHVLPLLGPQGHEVLVAAERSSDRFEAFFESFARAAAPAGLH